MMIRTIYLVYSILIAYFVAVGIYNLILGYWWFSLLFLFLIIFNIRIAVNLILEEKSRKQNKIMNDEGDRYDVDSDPAF